MNKKFVAASVIAAVVGLLGSVISAPANGANGQPSIDELRSTDAQIVKAISDLDVQVRSQQNEVAAANQAFEAAQQAVAQINANLQGATAKLELLKEQVRNRALEEYMSPRDDQVTQMLMADEISEATRRNELLAELSDQDRDALDQMRALKKDIDAQRKAANDATAVAEKRKNDAQKKLDELNAAKAEQQKAKAVLDQRIAAAADEDLASGFNGGSDDGKVSNSGVRWPIHGNHPVTSGFGTRWGRLHAGIDIGIPVGTPVFAAKDGTVTFSGPSSGYGNYICVQSDGGLMTCYGHLSRFETSVGAHVTTNTEIAKSGNTGHSTGAHLHFETCQSGGKPACYYNKAYKNPINYLP